MNINAKITISRDSNDAIRIRIRDETSRTEFVEAKLSLEDYALLITGLSEIPTSCEVRGLENVGKKKVAERRSVVYPYDRHAKAEMEKWIVDNCQEDGWIVSPYLGSQTSVVYNDGKYTLNYSVYRYVELEI